MRAGSLATAARRSCGFSRSKSNSIVSIVSACPESAVSYAFIYLLQKQSESALFWFLLNGCNDAGRKLYLLCYKIMISALCDLFPDDLRLFVHHGLNAMSFHAKTERYPKG